MSDFSSGGSKVLHAAGFEEIRGFGNKSGLFVRRNLRYQRSQIRESISLSNLQQSVLTQNVYLFIYLFFKVTQCKSIPLSNSTFKLGRHSVMIYYFFYER